VVSPAQAAAAAVKLDTSRKELMEHLKGLDFDVVKEAGIAVKLKRFATKLHHYPGDVSTAMLVKVTKELAS